MGIVSSAFLSLAVQVAWNFQRFLDPTYRRYVEPKILPEVSAEPLKVEPQAPTIDNKLVARSPKCNSTHQENRNRRAAQLRYRRKRPSSFDTSLIVRNGSKNATTTTRIVSSTPSTLKRQQAPCWNDSSSNSSSSSEDSDMDIRINRVEPIADRCSTEKTDDRDLEEPSGGQLAMSAAEEAAFRMTVGRGHFSRSKKDKFLNHLRLEKRLNDLNREFFELACRAHSRELSRHHSGDLRRVV